MKVFVRNTIGLTIPFVTRLLYFYKKLGLLLLSLVLQTLFANDIEDHKDFFDSEETNLRNEYRLCSGDTTTQSISALFEWKERVNLKTQTPQYKKILKEYITQTGIVKTMVPCMVLKWQRERMAHLYKMEKSIERTLLGNSNKVIDSIRMSRELQNNPITAFDFKTIPFGLSKKVFIKVFKLQCDYPLRDDRKYLFVEHYLIDREPFMILFYFSRFGIYYKYEIHSYSYNAEQLNSAVRPKAILLKKWIEKKIGPPDQLYRIGYFDIQPDYLTPYAKWEKNTHLVVIDIGLKNTRYYTQLTVRSETIPLISKKQGRIQ